MNARTEAHLRTLLGYWQGLTAGPEAPWVAEAQEQVERVLAAELSLDDARMEEYLNRLTGPEGCDFQPKGESFSWSCDASRDRPKSRAILADMGLDEAEIAVVHDLVDALGGHCDCEIVMNAAPRIFDEEEVTA